MNRNRTPTQTVNGASATSPADRPANVRCTKKGKECAVAANTEEAPDRSSPEPAIVEEILSHLRELMADDSDSWDDSSSTGSITLTGSVTPTGSITPRAGVRSLPDLEYSESDHAYDLWILRGLWMRESNLTSESEMTTAFEHKRITYEEYLRSFMSFAQWSTWSFMETMVGCQARPFREGTTTKDMERIIWAFFVERIWRHAQEIENYTDMTATVEDTEEDLDVRPVMNKKLAPEIANLVLVIRCCRLGLASLDWSFAKLRALAAGETFDEPAPEVVLLEFSFEDLKCEIKAFLDREALEEGQET